MDLLQNEVIPDLKAMNPVNPGTLDGVYFQQDGAVPHRTQEIKAYLKDQFGDRILGLGLPEIGIYNVTQDGTPYLASFENPCLAIRYIVTTFA